eukprot:scaffold75295_cov65-Phaeocystis_antarctica.AAC.3
MGAAILAPSKPQHASWQTHALAAAPENSAHEVALAPSAPAAALADSSATSQKKKMIARQYSSGDHAYLPNPQQTAAKNLAARQGVQQGVQQDSEGLSLPNTHERHSDGRARALSEGAPNSVAPMQRFSSSSSAPTPKSGL